MSSVAVDDIERCFFPNLNDGQPTDDQVKYLPIIPEYGKVAAFCNAHSIPISAFVHVSWTIALARYTGVGSPCFGIVENQSDLQVFALHLQDESNIAGISKDLASKKEGAGIHVLSWPIAARVCNTAVLVREGQESSSLPKDPTVLKSLEEKFKAKFDVLLIVTTSAIGATLELEYKSSHLSSSQACNLQQTLAQLLTDMALSPDLRVGEVWPLSERDRQQILNWNSAPLSTSYVCVHNVISARAEARPNAEALCTSDGSVSYAEFEMLTNRVACYLLAQGIPKHSKIPFCIERSSLVLIAMVGILKAGAAFVPLTPDQPMDRIRLLVGEVEAPLIVTSPAHAEKLSSVAPLAILSGDVLEKILVDMSLLHGLATPDDLAYVLFTSGSTGKPKGVLMEHKASCSSSFGYLRVLNMNEKSRVFQFATYTFDACIFETLSTLMGGGCVCIPSEHDRMNDVEGSMQRLRANTAFLTPTTGSFLNPQATGLDMVVTGGEAVPRQFIQDWAESVHLVQCYGPTETAVFITLQLGLTQDAIPNNIGKSTWAHIFLVDLKDPRRLAPVGAIGEIIIEGPGLARGYLNNPTATDAAFIEIPSWFDSKKMVRCYRTGDLARYGSDGCIHILGRKDTQAKLRGQRMELGEVEHHLSLCVPEGITTAAVIISSSESLYPPKLVGFLQSKETNLDTTLIPRIESALSQKLPSYMVPSDFLTLPKFPIAISSGKLDRKTMRQIGDEMLRKKQKQQSSCRPPSTPMEVTLQGLWAKVLCLGDCSSIGAESDFIRVGGDSIHAMKLVAAARSHGVSLTVKDVLSNPKLCEMASKAITGEAKKSSKLAPFALLDAKYVADIKSKAALACEVTEDAIEDIYPCTPLQEGFMAVSYRQKGAYVGQYVFSVSDTVPTNAAIAAWEEVYAATPALRTRIISTSDDKALQVVIRGTIDWQRSDDLGLYLSTEDLSMQLGEPLSRHAIILDKRSGAISIVCTLHHAIYDGWTLKLLEERLHQAYAGQTFVPDQFSNFIQFTQNLEAAPMVEFWKKYLCGVKKTCYPAIAQPGYVPKPQSSRRHKIQLGYLGSMGVTASSLIQVAWAILLARLTEEEEVVIGTTLTGRTVDLDGVEDLAGPTITTVPVRVRLHEYVAANPGETVKNKRSRPLKEVLTEMQEYSKTVIPHQHFGLQNIQSLSEDIRKACDFHSLLVVQPQNQKGPNKLFTGKYANDNMDGLHTYGLLFSCELTDSGVNVLASYDQNLVHGDHVSRLLFQLDHILQQMCNGRDMTVDDLVLVSPQDEKEIGVWNANITEPINDCVHNMIKRNRDRSPKNPAVNSWDGNLTYDELIQVSARLAVELVQRGVGPETIVPLAFDKSMWTIVAVLGVLQAGGAFVLLDMALPIERIKLIIRKVSAKVVVAGRSSLHKLTVPETFILDDNTVPSLPESTAILDDVKVAPNNAAYVMFTSGSTGEPKGCVLEHGSFCTSGWGQGKAFGMTPSTRSLQFASYSFAASIIEILTTMIHGGCVCVLSDEERMNNISNAIREREANWAFLTPSLLSVLDPNVVPSLKALSIGGEAIRAAQIVEWADRVDLQHGYGNAECCGVVCTNSLNKTSDTKDIGHAYTGRCWIVEPDNVHKLTPVGCVGEIVIEGRIVGRGYMNEPAKTAAAFISAPEWRSRFGAIPPNTSFYRTGDLGRYGATGGMLQYMGRKDTQIKYHGQRIELGEIEYHVKRSAPEWAETIVELVIPQNGTKDSAVLAVFIALKDRYDGPEDLKNLSDITKSMTTGIAKAITNGITGSVPEYMIPSVFIPLKKMPMTLSGKTYRKSLREIGAGLTIREMKSIVGTQKSTTVVTNQQEKVLQKSWAAVLELDENEISLQDSFFSLGGDSLSAMRLVAACRNGGISLTVKDIFHFPKLRDMAKRCAVVKDAKVNRLPPFKLLGNDRDAIVEAVLAAITDHTRNEIQDIYPALPAQKETLITSSRVPGAYMAQFSLTLPHDANIRKFQLAWDKTVAMNEILRTRIVDTESFGCMQVVSSHTPEWVITTDLDNYLKQDQALGMTFGSALCRSAIFQDPKTSCSIVVISLHHALYDGWSLPALLTTLSNNYQGRKNQPSLGFNEYIDMLQQQDKTEACNFWKSYLAGAPATRFPNVPKSHVFVDSKVEYELPSGKPAVAGVTVSTVLRVAWALLLAQYTAEDDVVFGSVHAARNIDIPGIERMIAPTVTCVPVRARFEPEQLVISLLSTFQEQTTAMMPFEYLGWSEIQSLNADATAACNFNNLFVVHPGDNKAQLDGFTCSEFSHDMNKFYIHPLTVECEFFDEKPVKATVHFDSKIMSHRQVERLLYQLECILHQVWNADDKLQVKNLQVSCTEDILDIINWNSAFKPLSEEIIHLAQEQQKNLSQKDNYRTWIVNPRNPNQLAGVGAIGELLIEQADDKSKAYSRKNQFWPTNSPLHMGPLMTTCLLARYNEDGSVFYVDKVRMSDNTKTQLRELEEVSSQVERSLPRHIKHAVKIVSLSRKNVLTVVFVSLESGTGSLTPAFLAADSPENYAIREKIKFGVERLRASIPSFKFPRLVPISHIPVLATGGVDYSVLEKIGVMITESHFLDLNNLEVVQSRQLTSAEDAMVHLWAQVLDMQSDLIGHQDDFLQLGGDSVKAMRLVAAARKAGYSLTVRDIYKTPSLSDMARIVKPVVNNTAPKAQTVITREPTPTATKEVSAATKVPAATLSRMGISETEIEDVVPCLPFQKRMLCSSLLENRGLIYYISIDLPSTIDIVRLMSACTKVVARHSILRTIFVQGQDNEVLQVIHKTSAVDIHLEEANGNLMHASERFITEDKKSCAVFDQPITRFILLRDLQQKTSRFMIRLSHAQFDGYSLPILWHDLQSAYAGNVFSSPSTKFGDFVRSVQAVDASSSRIFWEKTLGKTKMSQLVQHDTPSISNHMDTLIPRRIPRAVWDQTGYQPSYVLKTAWAMVLGELLHTSDVIFGEVISNRNVNMERVETVLGPCVNVVPVRVQMDHGTIRDILTSIKDQSIARIPYESASFQQTMSRSTDHPHWMRFSSVVVHQDIEVLRDADKAMSLKFDGEVSGITWVEPQWDMADLAVVSKPDQDNIIIHVNFSRQLIPEDLALTILDRLEACISSLAQRMDDSLTPTKGVMNGLMPPFPLRQEKVVVDTPKADANVQKVHQAWKTVFPSNRWTLPSGNSAEDANFLEFGGDFVTAKCLKEALKAEGLEATIEQLVACPTIGGQAVLFTR